MNAASIMSIGIVTLTPDKTVGDAVKLFFEQRIRQVPVVNEENVVLGVITSRILMRAALPGYIREGFLKDVRFAPELKQFVENIDALRNKPLSDFVSKIKPASPDYVFVTPETSTMEIAAIFVDTERSVDRILVVDNKKRLLGIISPIDIFKDLWKNAEKNRPEKD
ncbi:MAG: CBS domain-containing protein [Thermodesulfobacteriota bacterium]